MTISWIIIAIALLLFFLWLAIQPKQGARANNAPNPIQRDALPSGKSYRPRSPKAERVTHEEGIQPDSSVSPTDFHAQAPEAWPPLPSERSHSDTRDRSDGSESGSPLTSQSLEDEVQQLLRIGHKINAIQRVRVVKQWGLKEAKDYVEALEQPQFAPMSSPQTASEPTPELEQEVRRLLANHQKISAVKLVRDTTRWQLRDAKHYVDALQEQNFQSMKQALLDAFPGEIFQEIQALVATNQSVEAVQRIQNATGCDISQAVEYIAQIRRIYPPS